MTITEYKCKKCKQKCSQLGCLCDENRGYIDVIEVIKNDRV